jgi:hypothetical protein
MKNYSSTWSTDLAYFVNRKVHTNYFRLVAEWHVLGWVRARP